MKQFTQEELQKARWCIWECFGAATPLKDDEPVSQEAIEEVYRQDRLRIEKESNEND